MTPVADKPFSNDAIQLQNLRTISRNAVGLTIFALSNGALSRYPASVHWPCERYHSSPLALTLST